MFYYADQIGRIGNLELYRNNFKMLLSAKKPIVLRVPVIGGYTDDIENRKKVIELIRQSIEQGNVLKVELIKEHSSGKSKWQSLSKCNEEYTIPEFRGVSDDLMEEYC